MCKSITRVFSFQRSSYRPDDGLFKPKYIAYFTFEKEMCKDILRQLCSLWLVLYLVPWCVSTPRSSQHSSYYSISSQTPQALLSPSLHVTYSAHCIPSDYTGLFISPSGISEIDCATTKTDTAERSISIGRESLQVFFLY